MSKANDARLKLLMKDRKTFLRFCKFVNVLDADLIFESAAAKDVPIEIEDILANGKHIEKAVRGLEDYREFACLVFEDPSITTLDIKSLRNRWMNRQDSRESSERSVATLLTVQEQIRQQAIRIQELEGELGEKRNVQLNDSASQTTDPKLASRKSAHVQTDRGNATTPEIAQSVPDAGLQSLRHDLSVRDEKIKGLTAELQNIKDAKSVVESKLAAIDRERNKFHFVEELASKQAERDLEVAKLRAEITELKSTLPSPSPSSTLDEHDKDLRKNIFVKFATYAILNDYEKMKSLIPVATELFQLTRDDVQELSKACTSDSNWLSSFLRI